MDHKNLIVSGKCMEFIDETKRLIIKEVGHMPDAKFL
jgi:hypothetical protein